MAIHIPQPKDYVAGWIDENLEFVADPSTTTQFTNTEGKLRYRNNLCALKVENRSGITLYMQLAVSPTTSPQGLSVSSKVDPKQDSVGGTKLWRGIYAYVPNEAISVVVSWWKASSATGDPYATETLTLGRYADVVRISEGGTDIKTSTADDEVHLTSDEIRYRNRCPDIDARTASHYLYFDNDPDNHIQLFFNGTDDLRTPIPVPPPAKSVHIVANNSSYASRELQLLRCDGDVTELHYVDGLVCSRPYALAPKYFASGGSDTCGVTVMLATDFPDNHPVDVWPMGHKQDGSKKTLVVGGATDHTFVLSSTDTRWELHWDAGGDPKVIVKKTDGCPPPTPGRDLGAPKP